VIKQLKRKIILYIMIVISSFSVLFACGISYYIIHKYQQDLFVSMESQLKTTPPTQDDIPTAKDDKAPILQMEFCVVSVDESNQITVQQNDTSLTQEKIDELVKAVLASNKKDGSLSGENMLFCTNREQGTCKIVFASTAYLTDEICAVCLTALSVTLVFLAIVFVISLWVASIATKPVEKALTEQKRFVADASHELKTPLAVLLANNKIIEKTATANQKEWVESNNDEIQYMSEIISEMLTLAQTESTTNVSKTRVDITKLATKVCLQFEPVAYEKSLTLRHEIEANLSVNFDEKMLRQLIMILIDNAIKHEQSGGKVILTVAKRNNFTLLQVTNIKTLITPEKLPHIFERFYKVDESRVSEGFGLGLAIAKNITTLNGCTISATSTPQNGTTFAVKIPNIKS